MSYRHTPLPPIGGVLTRDNIGWNDPPGYDRKLGRMRTHTDDLFDHRKAASERITASLAVEKKRGRR